MTPPSDAITLPRAAWDGGRRNMIVFAVLGIVGVALWFATMGISTPERSAFSWLWAYWFWLTLSIGALGWLCSFWAAKAKWPILPRRTLELMAATFPIFIVLFIPVLASMKVLYPWMRPDQFDDEARKLFEHRHVWLNQGAFIVRMVVYFFVFWSVSELLLRWSTSQDKADNPLATVRSWKLGPGALPLLGFAIGFAGYDWLMSLNISMYSSMFGLYLTAGAAMAAMAGWILVTIAVGTPISGHHLHSMGKLLFAFMCFWAYTAFSQFMLIWIADIPEETPWHRIRLWSDWSWVGWFLVVFHFALPFVILLSKRLKFSKARLGFMAVWLLVAHAVDVYWVVMPEITGTGPHPSLSDLFAFIGVGGIALAFFIWRMRGRFLVPVGDPFLPASLEYHP